MDSLTGFQFILTYLAMLNLTKKLIRIKTIPGNTKALNEALDLCLSSLTDYTIENFKSNGKNSVLVYNRSKRPKIFKYILNGHLDIIPGKEKQFTPVITGDRLYGVGAMDMKGNVASLVSVFNNVAKKVKYPLGLQLVTDEETGGFDGTKYQIQEGVRSNFVIAGESTGFNIVNKAKGIIWLRITTKGKTAHGAYPWRGKNAIWKMHNLLTQLEKTFPIPLKDSWQSTLNLSNISTTNESFNKIPDKCTIDLDIRYIPEDSETILDNIKSLLDNTFEIEIVVNEPSLYVKETDPNLIKLQRIVSNFTKNSVKFYGANGSSDARHFTEVNCAGVEFGPVGGGIGTDKEWVSISSLRKYQAILTEFLLSE